MRGISSFDDIFPIAERTVKELLGEDWTFRYCNTRRKLGRCLSTKVVELSRVYAESYIGVDRECIVNTILHEIAHGLAMKAMNFAPGSERHGNLWKGFCKSLGIPNARPKTKLPVQVLSMYKWLLVNRDTREVYGRFHRRPKRDYSKLWVKGRRAETEGKLILIESKDYHA